jgi:hypothetical protein
MLGWVAIWLLTPIVVPRTEDRTTYVFAAVLAPLYLVDIWLVRPPFAENSGRGKRG